MKAKIFCLFFLIVLEFIVCPQNGWTQDNTIPMIGAYYFDGWSGKNNSQELWAQEAPTHLTEKLYNDYNERQPIWGWRNDDLAIMEASNRYCFPKWHYFFPVLLVLEKR